MTIVIPHWLLVDGIIASIAAALVLGFYGLLHAIARGDQ